MEAQNQTTAAELKFNGIAAVPGIVQGTAHVYLKGRYPISELDDHHKDESVELQKLKEAKSAVANELENVAAFIKKQSKADGSDIIETQKAILMDPVLESQMEDNIKKNRNFADRAIYEAFGVYIRQFKSSESEILQLRISDLRDLRDRLIGHIHKSKILHSIPENAVLVSDEISPTEVVLFSRQNVKAIVLEKGGLNAHASIIAGAMGIPMLVDAGNFMSSVSNGQDLIVDCEDALMVVNPGTKCRKKYTLKIAEHEKLLEEWEDIRDLPVKTLCGRRIKLRANLEFEEELPNIARFNADGIGLLRTESFFLSGSDIAINPESQEEFYDKAAAVCGDEHVTIRLFDVGGDKVLQSGKEEDNPFLGWRGIRILLDQRDLLRSQLTSIQKVAGKYPGKLRILIPMVSDVSEVLEVKKELEKVNQKLKKDGIPIDEHIQLGIMVEVPSTAVMAAAYAPHVDFFSIGTNDLTQYTLAVDRGNAKVSELYQQMHPAVWKLIRMTVDVAERYKIEVSVCGELASYSFAALILASMGICDLSMGGSHIPDVKRHLMKYSITEMKMLAEEVFQAKSAEEVNIIKARWKEADQK